MARPARAGESSGASLLIWSGRDWAPGRDWDGYGGVYDPSNAAGGRFDHIHISLQ